MYSLLLCFSSFINQAANVQFWTQEATVRYIRKCKANPLPFLYAQLIVGVCYIMIIEAGDFEMQISSSENLEKIFCIIEKFTIRCRVHIEQLTRKKMYKK